MSAFAGDEALQLRLVPRSNQKCAKQSGKVKYSKLQLMLSKAMRSWLKGGGATEEEVLWGVGKKPSEIRVKQGKHGNCQHLSTLMALVQYEYGRKLLQNTVRLNKSEQSVEVYVSKDYLNEDQMVGICKGTWEEPKKVEHGFFRRIFNLFRSDGWSTKAELKFKAWDEKAKEYSTEKLEKDAIGWFGIKKVAGVERGCVSLRLESLRMELRRLRAGYAKTDSLVVLATLRVMLLFLKSDSKNAVVKYNKKSGLFCRQFVLRSGGFSVPKIFGWKLADYDLNPHNGEILEKIVERFGEKAAVTAGSNHAHAYNKAEKKMDESLGIHGVPDFGGKSRFFEEEGQKWHI